jgi:hypothetical protein
MNSETWASGERTMPNSESFVAWCNDGQIEQGGPLAGITGQDGAYLARFLLEKGYVVHRTSRDAAPAWLDGLIALGISDQITLHSMSPAERRG